MTHDNPASNRPLSPATIAQTRHLRLVSHNGWDYVQRTTASGVVTVMGVTREERVLFVEQFRPPVGARVIEFPAGLAGDESGHSDESLVAAASRELMEETGYLAGELELVLEAPSSAGLTDEMISFFVARDLRRVGSGGGDASESIKVHEVDLDLVEEWLARQLRAGMMLDARLYTGLYLLLGSIGRITTR